ncbi:hypothetical protein CN643_17145 [Parageobacillus yumthangensis]|nr:hypothetical protein CN643_17145 [Parageobacillus yumthangensis]TXK91822.1 hypothetical protein FVE24_04055 [Parageobacillus sp. SY1]
MSDFVKKGYWSIATQKHLRKFTVDSPNLDEFEKLNISGKSGRLLGILRGNQQIDNVRKLEKMAASVGIGKLELHNIILPTLEKVSDKKIELKKDTIGNIVGLEEYIFGNNEVLDITGQLFEYLMPSNIERIAVESLDVTKRLPRLESELFQSLCKHGFREQDISLSCSLQEQFKLIQKLGHGNGKEPIFSNEYVWGPNHHKIAYAISNLELDKKQKMEEVIEAIQNKQGYPLDYLKNIDQDLLLLAKKTGIINPTTIVTNRGLQKDFGFSANLIQTSIYDDDILDDVKLLLASIRFAEHYTDHSTIYDPVKFLKALIDRDKVGPHSANGTDYILLEKRGIVQVIPSHIPNRYYLKLIRKDIGEQALKIISDAQFDINLEFESKSFESMMQYGSFKSAEEIRIELAQSPQNVAEAEEYLARVLRDEIL